MNDHQAYEGQTQRLPSYQPPAPADTSTRAFDPVPPHAPLAPRRSTQSLGRLLIAIGGLLLIATALRHLGGAEISQTASVRQLQMQIGSGDVAIVASNNDTVTVEARQRGWWGVNSDELERSIRVDGDTLRVQQPRGFNLFGGVDYRIALPATTLATIQTGSGDLDVADTTTALILSTGSGDINLDNVLGTIRAQTGSGSISIEDGGALTLDLETGSGDITIEGGEIVEDGRLQTGSGDVQLELPRDASLRIAAQTGNGDISGDWNIAGQRAWQGEIGSGGPTLTIQTGSGDIRIEQD
jgi:hypothetical protein